MCAESSTDESQCATLLASCSRDARKARADGVVGKAWFATHYAKFLDEVRSRGGVYMSAGELSSHSTWSK